MQVIFESHATTLDNEAQRASGWNDVALSAAGEQQAKEMGHRYNLEDFDAVYCSDLQRAYNTAQLAFPGITTEKLSLDWRLRECDYGEMTLGPRKELEAIRTKKITEPFPDGESYMDAMERMKSFIDDLRTQREQFKKVLIIGSRATQFGLDYWLDGKSLETLVTEKFVWQPGWKYDLNK